MTTKNETRDFDSAMISAIGSKSNVDKYYHRTVRIRGVIHHIRGRFELLIRSHQERNNMEELLNTPSTYHQQHMDIRRVTQEELAAIKILESDSKNWKNIGDIKTFSQPSDEDVPDYPPNHSNPSKNTEHTIKVTEADEDQQSAITDMQNEGGSA